MTRATAPYGSWASPITSALLTSAGITFGELQFSNGRLYWLESRPDEAGRVVLVSTELRDGGRIPEDRILEVRNSASVPQFNVRTRVHEYGGGAYFVHGDIVFFTNFTDQRLYRQDPGGDPKPSRRLPQLRRACATPTAA